MNTAHRYILEKGSKKHCCPECGKKHFVRYLDTKTGQYLPEQYGRCDRESKCSYFLNPYTDGYAKAMQEKEQGIQSEWKPIRKTKPQKTASSTEKPIFFDFPTFRQTLLAERYEKNTFIQNLLSRVEYPFSVDDVTKVIELYRLGTIAHGYRMGAVTFPFIDVNGNVRTIQAKQFDENNHTISTDFLHSILEKHYQHIEKPLPDWLQAYTMQEKRVSCLFGEHLLSKYPKSPVALVEAPKTAIYGTMYFGYPEQTDNFLWLAVYNKSSFSFDKLKVLKGRTVFVFPDLSKDGRTFREWESKAKNYECRLPGTKFRFSDLLEHLALEHDKSKGYDIADYLIKQDWQNFRTAETDEPEPILQEIPNCENCEKSEALEEPFIFQVKDNEVYNGVENHFHDSHYLGFCHNDDWIEQIKELELFFSGTVFPDYEIRLNPCSTISDIPKFIESHFSVLKTNKGKRSFYPFLMRLEDFKAVLLTINN
jgi:hypothetical protein